MRVLTFLPSVDIEHPIYKMHLNKDNIRYYFHKDIKNYLNPCSQLNNCYIPFIIHDNLLNSNDDEKIIFLNYQFNDKNKLLDIADNKFDIVVNKFYKFNDYDNIKVINKLMLCEDDKYNNILIADVTLLTLTNNNRMKEFIKEWIYYIKIIVNDYDINACPTDIVNIIFSILLIKYNMVSNTLDFKVNDSRYLKRYPDIKRNSYFGNKPFLHYFKYGIGENRIYFDILLKPYPLKIFKPKNDDDKTNINNRPTIMMNNYTGRVGNILWQFLACKNFAIENNYNYILPEVIIGNTVIPLKTQNNIMNNKLLDNIYYYKSINKLNIPGEILKDKKNLMVQGYFQNSNYINNDSKNEIWSAINTIKKLDNNKLTVIHVRCGDQWLYNKDCPVKWDQPIIPISFYKELLKDNTNKIMFVTENLNDPYILELKKHFHNAIFQSEDILTDFTTMMCADTFIMSISTLSWMAAFLNIYAKKIIFTLGGFWSHIECNKSISKLDNEVYSSYCLLKQDNITYYNLKCEYWLGDKNDFNNCIDLDFKNYTYIGNWKEASKLFFTHSNN